MVSSMAIDRGLGQRLKVIKHDGRKVMHKQLQRSFMSFFGCFYIIYFIDCDYFINVKYNWTTNWV